MHACPRCHFECDCDGEDMYHDMYLADCSCPCDPIYTGEEQPDDE